MSKKEIGYMITTDPIFLNEQTVISPQLLPKLEGYHHLAMGGKKSSIQKILDAIEQYPDNPQLKNYLSVLYGQLNDHKKMYDVNKWILAEHPNYLFGKLNLANEYYLKKEYDKMLAVLGREMDLKALYPDRDIFHITEVLSFLKTAILYFTAIGDVEQAEIRHEIMDNLAPDSSDTKFAFQQIHNARMLAVHKRYEEEQKSKISVNTKPQEIKTSSQVPDFYHEEIEWLYCHGLYFPEAKLNTILSLPKETLVQDLELVLQDSINRYGHFRTLSDENGWDEEKLNFVIHALYLLAEIKAVKSIDAIFNILSQSEEYLELYFGDILNESMWEIMFKIAADNLEACKQFMFKPGINTYARSVFPEMVEQLALHHPNRREEVINWFKDVMQFFLNSTVEDNVIDSEAIAFLICHVIDMNGKELLPEIKELFDKGMVSEGIIGDLEEVNKYIVQPHEFKRKQKVLPIVERYKLITSTWAGYNAEAGYKEETVYSEEKSNLNYDFKDYIQPNIKPAKAAPKIGRNESCPCGSGKKYKKCCLRM